MVSIPRINGQDRTARRTWTQESFPAQLTAPSVSGRSGDPLTRREQSDGGRSSYEHGHEPARRSSLRIASRHACTPPSPGDQSFATGTTPSALSTMAGQDNSPPHGSSAVEGSREGSSVGQESRRDESPSLYLFPARRTPRPRRMLCRRQVADPHARALLFLPLRCDRYGADAPN